MQSEPHVDQNTQLPITPKQRRGFAVIDKEKMRQVASRGGRTAHAHGLVALIRFGRQVDELLRLKCKFVLGCVPPF